MKIIRAKMVLCMLVGIAVAVPFGVFAQINPIGMVNPVGTDVGKVNIVSGSVSLDADAVVQRITTLVNWFAWFIALVSVVIGLYAGFLFITARGEAAQLKTARATLVWAVIGVAVAVLAFSIILLTETFFGL